PRELRVANPEALREALARLRRRQRPGKLLPAHPQLAGRPVERRERELLRDLLQASRVAPGPLLAGVLDLRRLIGGAAGGQVGAGEQDRRGDRADDEQLPPCRSAHKTTFRSRSNRHGFEPPAITVTIEALTTPPSSPGRSGVGRAGRSARRWRTRG